MSSTSVLTDIKEDLDGMPGEILADIKQLIADAAPALGTTVGDARSRGAAVGATLVGHLPDRVVERVPDAISDRLASESGKRSKLTTLLLVGGVAALGAVGYAAFKRSREVPVSHGLNGARNAAPGERFDPADVEPYGHYPQSPS